ncbi:MAG: biotin/lipoyl-binding protein [Lachnospiraceae bacterium]|nr:biotin/lipoyl-binding protein [Lachnospiraceae bacterium]MEE0284221.1 biotin/lipoyl-binding protein [Lachnospiraceae bacterium]
MNRSRLIRITAAFFAVMLCFTILSRAADQAGIAAVHVQKPESRMILHTVAAAGKVVQNREVAIVTEPDERVVEIAVEKGQKVAKGDLLFTIDTELLQEKILNQRQEIEKQKLQLGDVGSQQDVRAAQKANDQASAAEQYSLSTKKAQVQVSRAKRDLDAAKQALTDYRKKNGNGSTATDNTVEETLQNALEEKTAAYLDAQKELTALQWRIENAVNTALNETGAQLVKNGMCVTQAAEEEPLILEEPEGELEDAGAVDSPEQDTKQTDGESAQDIDIIIEPSDQEVNTGSEPSDSSVISSAIPGVSDTAQPSTPSHSDADDGVASPVPDRELTEQQVRDTYAQELDAATKKVETAKKEKEAAEQALMQYQQEQLTAADASGKEQERQLLAAVQTAGDAYEDAVLAANEAAVTAGRAVAAAGISDASDSTLAVGEITVEQMELQLEKLERLLEADGRICAPSDGLITEIAVNIGERTADTPAVRMADLTKGYRFTAELTKEQETYIGAGDEVTLTDSRRNQLEQLTVESVAADGENEGVYEISVPLPDDTLELGAAAVLDYSSPSQTYAICVPLAALHLDERNQPYVLTYDEQDSVLGKELRARKVSVNILDQNESYAALADGSISSQDEVIVSADKAVDDGSRIRLES